MRLARCLLIFLAICLHAFGQKDSRPPRALKQIIVPYTIQEISQEATIRNGEDVEVVAESPGPPFVGYNDIVIAESGHNYIIAANQNAKHSNVRLEPQPLNVILVENPDHYLYIPEDGYQWVAPFDANDFLAVQTYIRNSDDLFNFAYKKAFFDLDISALREESRVNFRLKKGFIVQNGKIHALQGDTPEADFEGPTPPKWGHRPGALSRGDIEIFRREILKYMSSHEFEMLIGAQRLSAEQYSRDLVRPKPRAQWEAAIPKHLVAVNPGTAEAGFIPEVGYQWFSPYDSNLLVLKSYFELADTVTGFTYNTIYFTLDSNLYRRGMVRVGLKNEFILKGDEIIPAQGYVFVASWPPYVASDENARAYLNSLVRDKEVAQAQNLNLEDFVLVRRQGDGAVVKPTIGKQWLDPNDGENLSISNQYIELNSSTRSFATATAVELDVGQWEKGHIAYSLRPHMVVKADLRSAPAMGYVWDVRNPGEVRPLSDYPHVIQNADGSLVPEYGYTWAHPESVGRGDLEVKQVDMRYWTLLVCEEGETYAVIFPKGKEPPNTNYSKFTTWMVGPDWQPLWEFALDRLRRSMISEITLHHHGMPTPGVPADVETTDSPGKCRCGITIGPIPTPNIRF